MTGDIVSMVMSASTNILTSFVKMKTVLKKIVKRYTPILVNSELDVNLTENSCVATCMVLLFLMMGKLIPL